MISEWLPNIHPMVVHLPIGLLVGAVLVDLVAVLLRRVRALSVTALVLYVLGALGLGAAYWTGQQAADTVDVPTEAVSALASHEDWALYTLIFFGAYALVRLGVFIASRQPGLWLSLGLWVVALGGMGLLWQTGDRGGELVYAHGVGVQAVDELSAELRALEREMRVAEAEPVVHDEGGWSWHITEGADAALDAHFDWVMGSPEDVEASVAPRNENDHVLELSLQDGPVLFVAGDPLGAVAIEADLNADDFDGQFALVHNVVDADTYHYWRKEGDQFAQGRMVDGDDEVLDEGTMDESGWMTLRATGAEGHFYGYVNDETGAHGHSPAPDAGPAGLWIDGDGTLALRRVEVEATE